MKKTEDKLSRTALTLLFGGVVFLILMLIAVVVGGVLLILYRTGIIAELNETMPDRGSVILTLIALSLVIGAGMTFFISRSMMKPMNRILNAMNQLASGNFKARLETDTLLMRHPSIREFSDSFNKMADELDHTEILRSDFVNNFSHEFKTPIVSIAGFAKLLRLGNLTEDQKKEYTEIIAEESLRLSDMATKVLNLTKIESQEILTDVTRFNLSEQIRSAFLLLEEKWTAKNLIPDMDFGEIEINGNEDLMREVWINLIDNAVKFARADSAVRISIRENDGTVSVSVEDEGEEIPPEERERIFRKFYQADTSHSSAGNGIGLAIVKKIVDLHSGTVLAESGNGRTVFTVTLPQ